MTHDSTQGKAKDRLRVVSRPPAGAGVRAFWEKVTSRSQKMEPPYSNTYNSIDFALFWGKVTTGTEKNLTKKKKKSSND